MKNSENKYEFVRQHYGVPACDGRIISHRGRIGIICKDRGNYIGVNFDDTKPGVIFNLHPTDNVEYLGMGIVRKPTKPQSRYQRYLEVADCFESFIDFCKYESKKKVINDNFFFTE